MREFTIEVKEREAGEACWLLILPSGNIGLASNEHITIEMPEGSDVAEAEALAREIKSRARAFRIAKF